MAESEAQKRYRKSEKGRKKQTELQKNWAKTEKGKACKRRWRNKHKKEINARWREYHRIYHYKSRYNLTEKQRQKMYIQQNGCCIICEQPVNYEKICTEHNHKTGKVRGLSCSRCNTFIGYIEKSPELVNKIWSYLEADYNEG